MKTNEGVPTHDLGFSSFLWSGHPVVGIGNWKTGPAYSFVDYTHGLMLDGETTDFAKLLGSFNVRYIVVQGYLPSHSQSIPKGFDKEFQSKFITQQEGLNLVWENQKTKIYENKKIETEIKACSTILDCHVLQCKRYGFWMTKERWLESGESEGDYDPKIDL